MKNFYKKPSCYTTLPNSFAQDHRLSIEARGLGLLIFSLPDDWVFRQTWFYEKMGGDGINRRKTVVKAINELIRFGYLAREQMRAFGKFEESVWMFDPEGFANEALKTALSTVGTESTYGSSFTVGTLSAGACSAGAVGTPIKEIEKKEELKKEKDTPLTPKRGPEVGGKKFEKKKNPTLVDLADQHQMTVGTLEDYVGYRLNSGGIENPIAFEKHVLRGLSEPYSDESVQLEEWFDALDTQENIIDHLLNVFLSTQRFDRRFCREIAKDDLILKTYNIVPSDVVIEIAFQAADVKRRERIGGAA